MLFTIIEDEQRHHNNLLFFLFVSFPAVLSQSFFAMALIMTGQTLSCQTKATAHFYSAKKTKDLLTGGEKKNYGLTIFEGFHGFQPKMLAGSLWQLFFS